MVDKTRHLQRLLLLLCVLAVTLGTTMFLQYQGGVSYYQTIHIPAPFAGYNKSSSPWLKINSSFAGAVGYAKKTYADVLMRFKETKNMIFGDEADPFVFGDKQQSAESLVDELLFGSPNKRVSDAANLTRRFPDVLLFGAYRCGTTVLQNLISLHPDIVSKPEQMNFFNKRFRKGLQWYRGRMPVSAEGQVTIERSLYFYSLHTRGRISRFNKNMKFILVVCDPTRRVVSQYLHRDKTRDVEGATFEDMVLTRPGGFVKEQSPLVQWSLYGKYFYMWLEFFRREQFFIVNGDELRLDPLPSVRQIENFLGLPHKINRKNVIYDESKHRHCIVGRLSKFCLPSMSNIRQEMNSKTLKRLRDFFATKNKFFFQLAGQTFDWDKADNK